MIILDTIINFLYPHTCLGCEQYGGYICETCAHKKLYRQFLQRCHVCGQETFLSLVHRDCADQTHLDGVVVAYVYNDFVQQIVLTLKYKYAYVVAGVLANLLFGYVNGAYRFRIDLLVPVPLSSYKFRLRGFNQAQLIAQGLTRLLEIPTSNMLQRSRNTRTQVGTSKESRLANLVDAFKVDKAIQDQLTSKQIMLVDDVMTTGATLEQCAKVLKAAGAEKVYALVFARG